jgi:glutathione S-transferase
MKLLEFPHSHYCEKARWALDFKTIPFQAVAIMPGLHMITVRKYAPKTSVPLLLNKNDAVQGSSEIIDYLEQTCPSRPLTPSVAEKRERCLEIEHAADNELGQNIRLILYHTLLAHPDFIRYCFTHSMGQFQQLTFSLFYPLLRNKIYQKYVISTARVEKAKREFDTAMNTLKNQLKDRDYLVGKQFTRADLSVASMLSLLVMPPEHPFPWKEIPDPETQAFLDEYQSHSVSTWVRKMYKNHRLSGSHQHSLPK